VAEETRAAETQEVESGEGRGIASEEPTTQQPGEETPPEGDSPATPQEGEDGEETIPKSELTKRNKENESLRKRLRKFEQDEEKRRKEQLSQTEALQEENQTLTERLGSLEEQVRRANFERAFGLPDAELAWGMRADLGVEAEYDDDLQVTNMDEIVKVAKKRYPRIWGNGSANGGERSEPPEPTGGDFVNSLFRGNRSAQRRR
jgi:hypothetical protein